MLAFEPDDLRSYGRIVRDARRPARAHRRGGRRVARGARARRGQLRDLRLSRREALARARAARAAQRAGRALRDRHARPARRRRRDRRRPHCAASRGRSRASTRASSSPFVAGEAARPDQRGAHARRRHDRRSGVDVDRGRRRDRAGRDDPPVHGHPRRRCESPPASRSARSPTSGPGTELGEGAKIGTFVELKKARVGARTKIPHLSYIGDAEIGEDTNIAAGNITANFPHEPGQPKGQTRDREQRQDRCRQYVPCTCRHWRRRLDCAGFGHHR